MTCRDKARCGGWLQGALLLVTAAAGAQTPPAAPGPAPAGAVAPAVPGPAPEAPKLEDRTRESLVKLPTRSELKPSGPMTIVADRFDGVQGASAIYTGHVTMSSDTLKFTGDRVELVQERDGHIQATVTGAPATLDHPSSGNDDPPMTAHANTMHYESRSGLIDLTGNARIKRGDDEISGETIRYNFNQQRIEAAGGGSGQVRVVIQPPPASTPAKAAPAPPAVAPAGPKPGSSPSDPAKAAGPAPAPAAPPAASTP